MGSVRQTFKHPSSVMDLMWLFTVPVLKLAIKIAIGSSAGFLIIQIIRWYFQAKPPNPFEEDVRVPRKPYVHDQKKRDAVIKQGFSKDKIPEHLDAIITGSGIGGMATGAIMSKAGKRVLLLEQHDQAGGCCHSFIDKGYEWDVGIHYIGEMGTQSLNKTLLDQIGDGQVEWAPLEKQFPDEEKAIETYFGLLKTTSKSSTIHGAMKLLPLWLVKLALATGVLKLFTNLFKPEYTKCLLDVVTGITSNKDLQTVFMYCWGDYGCPPSKSNFTMQALLNRHFMRG